MTNKPTLTRQRTDKITAQFVTNVTILKQLFNQSFGHKETDRIALCSLAQGIYALAEETAGMRIGSVQISKPENNPSGAIITVKSLGHAWNDDLFDTLTKHVLNRLKPMQIAANPPIDETALIDRLPQDEFVPEQGNAMQLIFAEEFNRHTLPGVRAHGGFLKVKEFHDNGPEKPYDVDLIAYGSCMKCGSAGTFTLAQLHRLETSVFKQTADLTGNRYFGSINVYHEDQPNELAYTVRADGIYDAQNNKTQGILMPKPKQ